MPETIDPARRASAKLRASLILFVADLAAPLTVTAEDEDLGVRASLRVEPIHGAGSRPDEPDDLPTPLPYSPAEIAVMRAIGPHGAKYLKNLYKSAGYKRPDDPRLSSIVRGLRERDALGHCEAGYFWLATNPDISDDGATESPSVA